MKQERFDLDLYKTHRAALTRYARTIVANPAHAEDVVQEAWFRLRGVQNPNLIRDPVSFLYRVVRNLAVDARRVLAREDARNAGPPDVVALSLADEYPSVEQTVAASSELRIVLEALDELPERTQIAVRMNRMEGKKLREVAEFLDVSVGRAHALVTEGVAYCDARRNSGPGKLEDGG